MLDILDVEKKVFLLSKPVEGTNFTPKFCFVFPPSSSLWFLSILNDFKREHLMFSLYLANDWLIISKVSFMHHFKFEIYKT